MSTIADLRQALAAALGTIPEVQVSAYILSNPTPPFIQIIPGSSLGPALDYDKAMGRGLDYANFTVQAVVARQDGEGAQKLLDRFMENVAPYSVKAAIEADGRLGGLCDDCSATEASGVQIVTPPQGGELLLVEWTVQILVGGTT